MAGKCPKCGCGLEQDLETGELFCAECGEVFAPSVSDETVPQGPPPRPEAATTPMARRQIDAGDAPAPAPDALTQALTPSQVAASSVSGEQDRTHQVFAGYQIQSELGRGGMGVVYKAFDPKLKRTVALKVLLSAEHASEEEIQRFFREAESAAKLQHPNIVPIHDLEVHEGKHYYTMDYIEGEPLDEVAKQKKLDVRGICELMEKVAQGLQVAHAQGIIHRDLKPANIIVAPDGEPKITDFGLAKVITAGEEELTQAGLTGSGVAMGTPFYEAPEQAAGLSKQVDARSDVYALGCILYEMLTGIPPFVAASAMEILRMQVEEDPVPPNKRGARVSPDIETICLKCLEKEPERRYQSAGELAVDLRRYLDGEPITARRASLVYITKKKLLRHKAIAGVISVAAALLIGATVWYVLDLQAQKAFAEQKRVEAENSKKEADAQRKQAEGRRLEAEAERRRADKEKQEAQRGQYQTGLALAQSAISEGNTAKADFALLSCPPPLLNWEWGHFRRRTNQEIKVLGRADKDYSWSQVAFGPAGKRVAAWNNSNVYVWDVATGKQRAKFKPQGYNPVFLSFSANGDRLIAAGSTWTCCDARTGRLLRKSPRIGRCCFNPPKTVIAGWFRDKTIRGWDIETGKECFSFSAPAAYKGGHQALSPDGKTLALMMKTEIGFWSTRTGKQLGVKIGVSNRTSCIAYSHDGTRMAIGTTAGEIRIANPRDGTLLAKHGVGGRLFRLAFSRDGRYLAAMQGSRDTGVFDVASGKRILALGKAYELPAFGPDNNTIVSWYDNVISIWDLREGRRRLRLMGHGQQITDVALDPSGQRLVSSDYSDFRLWMTAHGRDGRRLAAVDSLSYHVAFGPNGKRIVAACEGTRKSGGDGPVKLIDPQSGRSLRELRGHKGSVLSSMFMPDGKQVVSGGRDGTIRIWNAKTGKQTSLLKESGPAPGISALAISPDGSMLASAKEHITLWDARSGVRRMVLRTPFPPVNSLQFSPDGRLLASGLKAGRLARVEVWDVTTGRLTKTLRGEGDIGLLFSPDGAALTAVGRQGIRRWDLRTGRELLCKLDVGRGWISSVAQTPDGTRLAVGMPSGAIRILDSNTGAELLTLLGHERSVAALAFSPDGRTLLSSSRDETARLWMTDDWQTFVRQMKHAALSHPPATAQTQKRKRPVLFGSKLLIPQAGTKLDEETAKQVNELLTRLSSDEYAARESATRALYRVGRKAAPLMAEVAEAGDPEVRARVEWVFRTWLYGDPQVTKYPISQCRAYCSAQTMFKRTDWDGDGIRTYTSDFSALHHTVYKGYKVNLIDEKLAKARGPGGTPKYGYLFYNMRSIAGKKIDWQRNYGLCAVPAKYGETGTHTLIVCTNGTVFSKDTGGKPVLDYPRDPSPEGWLIAE